MSPEDDVSAVRKLINEENLKFLRELVDEFGIEALMQDFGARFGEVLRQLLESEEKSQEPKAEAEKPEVAQIEEEAVPIMPATLYFNEKGCVPVCPFCDSEIYWVAEAATKDLLQHRDWTPFNMWVCGNCDSTTLTFDERAHTLPKFYGNRKVKFAVAAALWEVMSTNPGITVRKTWFELKDICEDCGVDVEEYVDFDDALFLRIKDVEDKSCDPSIDYIR
jgi:hypothetical protein